MIFYFFETPTNLDSESKVSEESVQVYSGKKEIEISRQADFFLDRNHILKYVVEWHKTR